MRKASIVLAIAACASSSLSLAEDGDRAPAMASPVAATTSASTDDDGREHKKSGFGQVMSVLTGLLQDAAGKESAGASSSTSQTLSSEESAVTITVTPVAGRSTFFVGTPPVGKAVRGTTSVTSPSQAAVATMDANAADAARVAMQAEGALPD